MIKAISLLILLAAALVLVGIYFPGILVTILAIAAAGTLLAGLYFIFSPVN